jgi:hypothetical protein
MKAISLRYASLSLLAVLGAATAGCATDDMTSDDTADTSTVESELVANETPAWNFFIGKGLTAVQTAGIIGNLMQESGMSPTIAQSGGGPGRGIAQWSVGGRWDTSAGDNLKQYASQHGLAMTSLTTELDFIWFELTTFSGYGLAQLRASTTITAAVTAFQNKYEICGACDQTNRISFANEAFNAFAGASAACSVHSDSKLYCDNTAGAAMRATPTNNGTIVNHLRTTFSFFECWGTGDLHAGGNTTWYHTIGDDNATRGWVPAVNLDTTSAFDANPSAHGLPHC